MPHIQRDLQIEDVPMVVELVTISNETNLPSATVLTPSPRSGPRSSPIQKKTRSNWSRLPRHCRSRSLRLPSAPASCEGKASRPKLNQIRCLNLKSNHKHRKCLQRQSRREAQPPDEFAAVLKNLAKEFKKSPPTKKPEKDKKVQPREIILNSRLPKYLPAPRKRLCRKRITMTERHAMINTIRTAIQPCWNPARRQGCAGYCCGGPCHIVTGRANSPGG